ncbi:RNA ligase family protein [Embleya sp. NPDC127516]|uniref:RNA ligase family protein n=1 Tax=Embleya sp. NPDC127516 TaxID=3363990 RepID=UPI0037F75E1C
MSEAASHSSVWIPYPKISAKARLGMAGGREWLAQEKVHGAHFAVVCDGFGVRPAKRRELLSDDLLDDFFGVSRIWPGLSVSAARFAAELRGVWGDAAVVTIYGELAGGHYPHPDVPADSAVEPVQTGVWYTPDLHWLLFDTTVETENGRCWISERALRDAAAGAGLRCVPTLAHGSLNSLQRLPCAYPSLVPGLFGLPALVGNLAEGYVLKPAGDWWEHGDAGTKGSGARPVAKVKQNGFAEDERFAGSRPYLAPPEGATGVPAWLLVRAAALLTPTRAAAAVSKLGPRAPADAVVEEITRDAAEEIADAVGGLPGAHLRALIRALEPGARALTRFDADERRAARPGRRLP